MKTHVTHKTRNPLNDALRQQLYIAQIAIDGFDRLPSMNRQQLGAHEYWRGYQDGITEAQEIFQRFGSGSEERCPDKRDLSSRKDKSRAERAERRCIAKPARRSPASSRIEKDRKGRVDEKRRTRVGA